MIFMKSIFYSNLHNMEGQKIKHITSWGQEITYTVDKHLNSLKGRVQAPEKVKLANEHLRKIKNFPPELNIKPLDR
jgi:hypothetical protein